MAARTPLYAWHAAHGGKMVDFAGWDMPLNYDGGILAEHLAVRRAGGLFDVSHMGRLRFHGSCRLDFLQQVLSNNCLALEPDQAHYTMLTTPGGGALDDAFLYRFGEEDYLLVVNASNRERDLAWLGEKAAAWDGVEIEDVTTELALLALQGPVSHAILAELGEASSLPEPHQGRLAAMDLAGIPVLVSRTGYTGEPNSFELFVPAGQARALWEAILAQGQARGVTPVGLGARDTLRLEAGMPLYGHELGADHEGREIPIFALGLAPAAVSFSPLKGDFVGREPLACQLAAYQKIRDGLPSPPPDLPRRILPLALLDKGVPRAGYTVWQGERQVGVVTSGTSVPYWIWEEGPQGPALTDQHALRPLALAYLDSHLMPGAQLEVEVRGKRLKALVVAEHGRSEAPPWFRPLLAGWQRPRVQTPQEQGRARLTPLLSRALTNHRWRQSQCVNLIPSEQSISPLVRMLSGSDPAHRYAEHRPLRALGDREVYYYQGADFIAWVEERLKEEMAAFLGCPLVEPRPISGQMANMTLFSALCAFKDRAYAKTCPRRIGRALTHHIGWGGHLSAQPMGALRDFVTKDPVSERFAVVNFPVRADNPFALDVEATGQILEEYAPELVVLGKSMVIQREPVTQLRALIDQMPHPALLMYDMAHVLGLLGPHFQEPFQEGAQVVTGSTHKTFFGPQRGIVGCDFAEDTPLWELWEAIRRRAFPGMTSNHHLGTLLGLLAAAVEMNSFKHEYQPQVLANARALAQALAEAGLTVLGDASAGYTETHQVLVEVGYGQGPAVARRLEESNIICNYQALPWDEGFSASSGLRLGVQEMTRFGLRESDCPELAQLMARVILEGEPVGAEVARFRERFTTLGYCFRGPEVDAFLQDMGELAYPGADW